MDVIKLCKIKEIAQTNMNTYSGKESWKIITYLDTGNITENKIDQIQYIDLEKDTLPSRARRKVCENDILYSTVRPNQKHYGFVKNYPENILVSTGFTTIRVKPKICDAKYLYYYLTHDQVINHLQAIAEQTVSTYPSIKASHIEDLEIPLPSLPIQKKIASILSSLDDKIELNTRMNNVLEEIARALFNQWFVEFEFPNAEGKPYKSAGEKMVESEMGMVPEGWDIVSFRDIITVRTEKSNDPDIPEYSVTNLGIYPRDEKYKKKLSAVTSKNKIVHKFDLVFGMSREILNWGLMKDEIGGVSSAYNVFILDQIVNPLYLESFMKNNLPYFKDVIKPASREGQGVDKAALYSKNIYLPPQDVLDSYYKIEERLLSMCKYHDEENARLTEIRDTLLPKLMRGELNITS
jgi:type I restriction enzyme S subunit